MFYLIGIGLNEKGISLEGLEACRKCKLVYLENYTVDFPYSFKRLEKVLGKKVIKLGREQVESEKILNEAEKQNIALLVYGSPLVATTHISLILACKKKKIPYKIVHATSVLDAVAETGLQLYKFGKITNITKHPSESFFQIIEENQKIGAHSLILLDIGLSVSDALQKLKEKINSKQNEGEVIICSQLGTKNSVIKYGKIENLLEQANQEKFKLPVCIIIPGKLHFIEKETIERYK